MAWVTNPVHTFASLYARKGDSFTVNEDCLAILEEILRKLASEDCTLRTFRRAIGFGENIRKDLIPLLLYVKDDTQIIDATKIIDTTIKILVNLTIPVEYLLSTESMSRTDVGKHTIFELNKLLTTSKEAFIDSRSTKAVVDHMKYVVEKYSKLNLEQCDSINNCLLLLRNILHVPETKMTISNYPITHSSMQNQIIWNLFTQSIDKIIIYLMSCSQKIYWGVTMVQLIALMYKDQHVGTLQKLLNLWLEASFSESSEDNESNTSPPDQNSGDSSPFVTSDPTSDSSDTGGSDGNNNANNTNKNVGTNLDRNKSNSADMVRISQHRNKTLGMKRMKSTETETSTSSGLSSMGQSTDSNTSNKSCSANEKQESHQNPQPPPNNGSQLNGNKKRECPSSQSEVSDCGYVTQVENQESISTSSNDDDQPHQKPVHQKPHSFQKSRYNNGKIRTTTALEKKEIRRKKLVKRSKTNIINMKGLIHHLPTDEDIANILKEFTVDFLLKGYGTLVQDLHSQLLTNIHVQIDTSHFFWLVTYFLKFATQLELEPKHISPVLSFDVLSYLVFQGVLVYEELEISCRVPDIDLKSSLRRLHLVVTAIREFLQAVETYLKMIHLSDEDRNNLLQLQLQISETDDLRSLFVLLLRQYNPKIQSKQYLQDLILTNHNYLLFLENTSKIINKEFNIMEHLKQFATVEIMKQYGLLLENFKENGEFVNNCIFTMMHHIGGDLKHVPTLFQPSILKTFSQIWETDYEICDDWSDLIEYVIHKFINTPRSHCSEMTSPEIPEQLEDLDSSSEIDKAETSTIDELIFLFRWTLEEKENLLSYYNRSRDSRDTIASITKIYEESGMKNKTQLSIIKELLDQNIINEHQYNDFMKIKYPDVCFEMSLPQEEEIMMHNGEANDEDNLGDGDIKVLKKFLFKENKGKFILWLQKNLLEACYVKLVVSNPELSDSTMEPCAYYNALLNLPIPVVPWSSEQTSIFKHQPFVLLLHKLGLYLPVDTGKIFVRIPNFWNADYIFSIAQQLGPIDPAKLKFNISTLKGKSKSESTLMKLPHSTAFSGQRRFSMNDLKQTPSIVRYTPLTSQLSITIPETDMLTNLLPAPEISIANNASNLNNRIPTTMECCPTHEPSSLMNDIERNSICDTASVASDLTRMCVSDEEDKISLVLENSKSK